MAAEWPDSAGYFGDFGGRFAPEILMQGILELERVYSGCRADPLFQDELERLLEQHGRRATPLYLAEKLGRETGEGKLFLKREDLCGSGSHHFNSALGQGLVARSMDRRILVTDTSTGLHGIATARTAAILDLRCHVFIGAADRERQGDCVEAMQELGAQVTIVDSRAASLLEANEEATRCWLANLEDSFYLVNSAVGPHPYPLMVREFQSVIGREVREQLLAHNGSRPDHLVAAVGGGSNALGLFYPFMHDRVTMTAVHAGGGGQQSQSAPVEIRAGVYQGTKTMIRQDPNGQLVPVDSVAVGLQAALASPELAYQQSVGRVSYEAITDQEAIRAFQQLEKFESISPAIESAHALAFALRLAEGSGPGTNIVVNLCGGGRKDAGQLADFV